MHASQTLPTEPWEDILQLGSITLIRQPVLENENSEFKLVKLCLKIDPVSNPTHAEVLL